MKKIIRGVEKTLIKTPKVVDLEKIKVVILLIMIVWILI